MAATKAIFFDWYNTLARHEPPREEVWRRVLREFGVEVPSEKLLPGLMAADAYFFEENANSSVEKRDPRAKAEVYGRYQSIVLAEAGVTVSKESLLDIMKKVQQLSTGMTFVLFDDVLPTLEKLKGRGLILGLITNASRKTLSAVYQKLGLEPYLDFVVTSEEVGADKPKPPIFLMALNKSGVDASEAIHVGDQYQLDVTGARGVGISPVLIDRFNLSSKVKDCPRIKGLPELLQYL